MACWHGRTQSDCTSLGLLAALGLGLAFYVLAVGALVRLDVLELALLVSDGVQLRAGLASKSRSLLASHDHLHW